MRESPILGHKYGILPLNVPNLGYLECYTPLMACGFEYFNREQGILFLSKGIACGYAISG